MLGAFWAGMHGEWKGPCRTLLCSDLAGTARAGVRPASACPACPRRPERQDRPRSEAGARCRLSPLLETLPRPQPARAGRKRTGTELPEEERGWRVAGSTAAARADGAACLSVLLLGAPEILRGDFNLPRKETKTEPAPFSLSQHPGLLVVAWSFPWPREGDAEAGEDPAAGPGASPAAAPWHRGARPARQHRREGAAASYSTAHAPDAAQSPGTSLHPEREGKVLGTGSAPSWHRRHPRAGTGRSWDTLQPP